MGIHNVRLNDPTNHLPSDLRFYLWPYFLKLSPSYAEVHRLYTTNPRAPRRPRIPAALKAVAEVYEIVGDVYTERVFDWPRDRWVEVFGMQLAPEQLKLLCVLKQGRQVNLDALTPIFNTYLETTRPNMDNPTTMILAIPLDQKVDTTISTIREAIQFYRGQDVVDEDVDAVTPQLALKDGGPRLVNLIEMYKTVLYKAAHPDLTAWEIAYNLNLSHGHNLAIDTGYKDISESDAKKALGNITTRNLKIAFNIAENAARGEFPLINDVDTMTVEARPYAFIAALQDDPLPLAVVRNAVPSDPNNISDDMFADRGFTDGTVF